MMAEGDRITSEEAGSIHGLTPGSETFGDVKSTPKAQVGKYPEEYEHMPDSWKRAYDHAAGRNNSVKAATLYADSHERDFEEVPTQKGKGAS